MALELVHGRPGEKGFEILDMDGTVWKMLMQLAEANGWQPRKDSQCNFSGWAFFDNPGRVSQEEAADLATALTRALETPELKNARLPDFFNRYGKERGAKIALQDPNYSRFNGLSRELIESFVTFLNRGKFIYAIGD